MSKFLFVTVFLGDNIHEFITNNKILKNSDATYVLFTNNNSNIIKNDFWNIMYLDIEKIKIIYNTEHKVKLSRFIKFNIYETLKHFFPNNNFDYYIYCDSQYVPIFTNELRKIITSSNISNIGITQYLHPVKNITLNEEMNMIVKCNKDTNINMNKCKTYLNNICSNPENFKKILFNPYYVENSIIIYHLKNKNLQNFLYDFNKLYINCPTYRDQPLWNFMLQFKNYKVTINNNINKHFLILERNYYSINHYSKKI